MQEQDTGFGWMGQDGEFLQTWDHCKDKRQEGMLLVSKHFKWFFLYTKN